MIEEKPRNKIAENFKWDLRKIIKDEAEFNQTYEKTQALISKLESYKGNIMNDADSFYEFIIINEEKDRLLTKLYLYAHMLCDSDTKVTKNQSLKMKTEKLNEISNERLSFVAPEILGSDYEKVLNFIKGNKKLEKYQFDLEKTFRYKKHTLSQKEEEIVTKAINTLGTGNEVFYNLNNADIKLGKIKTEDGTQKELTSSNFIKYMSSLNRDVRKRAFNKMYKYYEEHKNTIGAALKGNIKENFFISNVRKYESPLVSSLFDDNIDISVYKNLIETVHDNLNIMDDYMLVRKKMLGLSELHMYDIYVDLIKEEPKEITFEEGKKIIFSALKPLGEKYLNDLKQAFTDRWIDIYPNTGKKSGAYQWGCYDTTPYVLLNYNNTSDSVSTMAHELGHAMHSYYSSKNQDYVYHNYPIFLAEIASTVNEVLLTDYLYKNAKIKNEKILYLTDFLDKVRTTIYRQTMFAEFEMIMHEKEKNNIALTSEEFSNTYYNLNKLYYGDNVISDKAIKYEWARIPHFYSSFYVYKYATGLASAIAIASDILENKKGAKDKYMEFLSSGCSDYPLNILKEVGVDMTTKKPIEKALQVFREKLEELKQLI